MRARAKQRAKACQPRVELALKLEPLLKAKAREKQSKAGKEKLPQNSSEAPNHRETRAQLAKIAGVSHDTIAKLAANGQVHLSERQCEIADLVWREARDKEITATLGITHGTLRTHLARLMKRLKVSSRCGVAVAWERRERARLACRQNADKTTSGNSVK